MLADVIHDQFRYILKLHAVKISIFKNSNFFHYWIGQKSYE